MATMSPLRSSRWNRLNLAMLRCCGVCTDPKSPAEFQVVNDMLASGNGSLSCRAAAAEGEEIEGGEDGKDDEEKEACEQPCFVWQSTKKLFFYNQKKIAPIVPIVTLEKFVHELG